MKKQLFFLLLAALSILLCAFSVIPVNGRDGKPDVVLQITTAVNSDGSGDITYEVILSQDILTLLKSLPGFPEGKVCGEFQLGIGTGTEWTERESEGTLTCTASESFANLEELKSLIAKEFNGAYFTRLEISGGHLYFDLAANLENSYDWGMELPFGVEAWWILKVPGEVVETNADKTSGTTLTWNLLTLDSSSHIRAESKVGGGVLGLDPAVMAVFAVVLLGCCCVVIIIAAAAGFFLLRKKNK